MSRCLGKGWKGWRGGSVLLPSKLVERPDAGRLRRRFDEFLRRDEGSDGALLVPVIACRRKANCKDPRTIVWFSCQHKNSTLCSRNGNDSIYFINGNILERFDLGMISSQSANNRKSSPRRRDAEACFRVETTPFLVERSAKCQLE